MTLRTLRSITITLVSHFLLASLAFTSEAPGFSSTHAEESPAVAAPRQDVTIRAQQQEKQGDLYKLDGDVEVLFENYVLRAEHATYNDATGEVDASGRVVFEGGPHDAHLTASHATYNVKTQDGVFYGVFGTFGAVARSHSVVLTTANPFVIAGREVRKQGANRYIVLHGSITTCAEATPHWSFNAEKIEVVAGEDARIYHSNFRILRLPIFYVPYTKLPASETRKSGLLLPTFGESGSKGWIVGESFYWAPNRSNDLTLGLEYYSKRGLAESVNWRSRPTQNSAIELRYFGVRDRENQGGDEVRLAGAIDRETWRGSADVDYLSSFLFRQAFSESYTQAVNSEVRSVIYASRNRNGLSLNLAGSRYQNFQESTSSTTTNAESNYEIKILHLPVAEANWLERPLGTTPLRWSLEASGAGLQRSEPSLVTASLVGRLDLHARLALPTEIDGWQLRPEIGLRETFYTQQLGASGAVGTARGDGLNRRNLDLSIELRPPVLERVYEHSLLGHRFKHVIEPSFRYTYTTGIDNFQKIIRFDEADVFSDTNEFQYDLVQRIYGRHTTTEDDAACQDEAPAYFDEDAAAYMPGVSARPTRCGQTTEHARQLLVWEVKQKYFLDPRFGGALVVGRRNVFNTTEELSGMAFLDRPRNLSPVVSKLRVETSANTDIQWQLDYDSVRGRINSSATFAEYRIGEYFAGISHSFFRNPTRDAASSTAANTPAMFDQFRYLLGYGHANKRGFSGGFSLGYDPHVNFLQYVAAQSSYNWECCGVSVEYRHVDVPSVINDNQYRFAFTLANIGSLGNMRRRQRLY